MISFLNQSLVLQTTLPPRQSDINDIKKQSTLHKSVMLSSIVVIVVLSRGCMRVDKWAVMVRVAVVTRCCPGSFPALSRAGNSSRAFGLLREFDKGVI